MDTPLTFPPLPPIHQLRKVPNSDISYSKVATNGPYGWSAALCIQVRGDPCVCKIIPIITTLEDLIWLNLHQFTFYCTSLIEGNLAQVACMVLIYFKMKKKIKLKTCVCFYCCACYSSFNIRTGMFDWDTTFIW